MSLIYDGETKILLEKKTLKEDFSDRKINIFCEKKDDMFDNDFFFYNQCHKCKNTCCTTCLNICHKVCENIKKPKKSVYLVSEYFSSCECKHSYTNELKNIKKLSCFYSYFLQKNFSKQIVFYKSENDEKCLFCYTYCNNGTKYQEIIEKPQENYSKELISKCKCIENSCHIDFDLRMDFFKKIFNDSEGKIIKLSEIRQDLLKNLQIYFEIITDDDYSEYENEIRKNKQKLFIESQVDKFCIYLIMNKTYLVFGKNDEIELFDRLFAAIKNQTYEYISMDCTNLVLTFIFYYFKKYIFDQFDLIDGKILNNLLFIERKKLIDENKKNFRRIKDNLRIKEEEIFELIKIILNRKYSIKISDFDENVPFGIYLIKQFFSIYCLEFKLIEDILELLLNNNYKENFNEYNCLLRKMVDETFYICQVYKIDSNILVDEKFMDEKNKDVDKLLNLLYFSMKIDSKNEKNINEINLNGNKKEIPENFYNLMFKQKNIYLNIKEKNEFLEEQSIEPNEEEKKLRLRSSLINMRKDQLYFFDCFHNSFLIKVLYRKEDLKKKIFQFSSTIRKIEIKKTGIDEDKFQIDLNSKNEIFYFKNFRIEINNKPESHLKILQIYIRRILENFGWIYDKKKDLIKSQEFLDDLFNQLLKIYKLVKKNENNVSEFIISSKKEYFRNENHHFEFDLKSINIELFKEDLICIFYIIFNLEFHKKPEFQQIIFEWNLLLIFLISNGSNVKFLLKQLKFFDFILDISEFEDNNFKKSFLIRTLFNTNKNLKENNYTFKVFYIIFKYYISSDLQYNDCKSLIMDNFIKEIIEFYSIQFKNHEKLKQISINDNLDIDKSIVDTMNYPLIFYFLKILKNMLIKKNPNEYMPFAYNVNKFEIIQKINIFANIANLKPFRHMDFLSSYIRLGTYDQKKMNDKEKFFQNSINDNNNNENLPLNQESSYKNENVILQNEDDSTFLTDIIVMKLNQQNVMYLLIEILADLKTTIDLNVYFEILNKNFYEFRYILVNKNRNFEDYLKKYYFKLEKTILKFMLNFLLIKNFDYEKLDIISSTDLKNDELIKLGLKEQNTELKPEIDFGNKNFFLESKYLINKMKINILDFLNQNYLSKLENIFSAKSLTRRRKLGSIILLNFSSVLKELWLNQEEFRINYFYQKLFFETLKKFLINLRTFDVGENIEILQPLNYENLHMKMKKIKNSNIDLEVNSSKSEKNEGINIESYFGEYIIFDIKNKSTYKEIITDALFKENHSKIINQKIEIKKKIENKDGYFSNEFWININEKFTVRKNPINLQYLLDYFFEHLKILDEIEGDLSTVLFDYVFTENFLKIINFLNNILYYKPEIIQNYLEKELKENQMKILMKYLIKLNNYIIGIADYESNDKLISSSKIYFNMMDFFILISEGIYDGNIKCFFFKDLDNKKKERNTLETKEEEKKNIPEEKNDDKNKQLKDIKQELKKKKQTLLNTQLLSMTSEYNFNNKKPYIPINPYNDILKSFGDTLDSLKKNLRSNVEVIEGDRLNDSFDLEKNLDAIQSKITNSGERLQISELRIQVCDLIEDYTKIWTFVKNALGAVDIMNMQVIESKMFQFTYLADLCLIIMKYINGSVKDEWSDLQNDDPDLLNEIKNKTYDELDEIFRKIPKLMKNINSILKIEIDLNEITKLSLQYKSDEYVETLEMFFAEFESLFINIKKYFSNKVMEDKFIKEFLFKLYNQFKEKLNFSIDKLKVLIKEYLKSTYDAIDIIKKKETLGVLEATEKLENKRNDDDLNDISNRDNKILTSVINKDDQYFKNQKNTQLNDHKLEKDSEGKNILEEQIQDLKINENNFFHYNFIQMKKIINSIITCNLDFIPNGSERLILQFLYISRFIKEYVELSNSKTNDQNRKIVNNSFTKHFNFEFLKCEIFNKYQIKEGYSYIIRSCLLKILDAYLEENVKINDSQEVIKIIYDNLSYEIIFEEIIQCFDLAKSTIKKTHETNYDYSFFYQYIENENLYDNKWFKLAQMYYKVLRRLSSFYDKMVLDYELLREKVNYSNKNKDDQKKDDKKKLANNEIVMYEKKLNYYDFLKFVGKQIEIKFKENENEKDEKQIFRQIYFFKTPRCFWNTNTMKNFFLDSATRSSLGAKIDYLNKNIDRFLLNISISFYKKKYANKKYINISLGEIFKRFSAFYLDLINFIMVFIMNILLLFYFYRDSSVSTDGDLDSQMYISNRSDTMHLLDTKYNLIFYIDILFTVVQVILILIWMYFRYYIRFWLNKFNNNKDNVYLLEKYNDDDVFKTNSFNKWIELSSKFNRIEYDFLKKKKDTNSFEISYYKEKLDDLFLHLKTFNSDIFLIFMCMIFNCLYLITNYKLFLVLQVFSVVNLYSLFNYFLKAILNKFKEFIALLVFIWFFEYIFSWISFLHFQEFMISDHALRYEKISPDTTPELLCSTAIECFLNYVHLGLRAGGGIGDTNPRISFKYNTKNVFLDKIVWDTLFHIIINLILGNIFFGVIVDTFNDLRDEKSKNDNDKENKCYICNRERYDMDKGIDFDDHRKKEHKIYDYIYVIPYLFKKNPQEYSRSESFVWEQINLHKTDWFPIENEKNNDEEEEK